VCEQGKFYGGHSGRAGLATAGADAKLKEFLKGAKLTQSGARARTEARLQRIVALQQRAEERANAVSGLLVHSPSESARLVPYS